MSLPMLESSIRSDGVVVNTGEEFFLEVKLHNPFPNIPGLYLELRNCRLSVINTNNSAISPVATGGLPKTVLGHVSLTPESTPNNEWDQEFTLTAGSDASIDAEIEYEAVVDLYVNGVTFPALENITISGSSVSNSPEVIDVHLH